MILGRARLNRPEVSFDLATALHKVVIRLQAQKEPLGKPEIPGKSEVCVRGHVAFAEDDLIDPARRHMDRPGQRVLTEAHRLQKLFEQNFSRMRVQGDTYSPNVTWLTLPT